MSLSTLLNIRYRNICYYPTSKVEPLVRLPEQLLLPAEPGKGTYEPLAVYLHEQGHEFSALFYEHQFVPAPCIRDRYPSDQLDRWLNPMSFETYKKKLQQPKTEPAKTSIYDTPTPYLVGICILICIVLLTFYAAIVYGQLHPTYVASVSCPTSTITLSTKSKAEADGWTSFLLAKARAGCQVHHQPTNPGFF